MSEQWTLPLQFREFEASDYERLAELYGSIFPDYTRTQNEWKHWDEMIDRSKYYFKRFTCLSRETGEILGFGQSQHAIEMFHPNKYWLDIWVDPRQQKKGVGNSIYERLNRDLAERGFITCWTGVREDMRDPIRFVEKRGFQEKRRAWESRIDPSTFDPSPFQDYSKKASSHGISMSTLAEEQKQDPECHSKLHEVVNSVSADMPRSEPFTPIPYQQWMAQELKNPDLLPEGYMIAKDRNRYVGVSVVWRSESDPHGLYQGNTGVTREYRGRGIAIALKLRVLDYAKNKGYERVKTWNDSTNAAMLGINTRLGFKRQVGWITFEKNLA
jgi:GNAT superfamily N-acetyltransferase